MKLVKLLSVAAVISSSLVLMQNAAQAASCSDVQQCGVAAKKCTCKSAFGGTFSGSTYACKLPVLMKAAGNCQGMDWVVANNSSFKKGFCARTDLCDDADAAAACGIKCDGDEEENPEEAAS